jgi:hypothetical protein
MHAKQLALLHAALDAAFAECLRSPVATLNAGHLRAVLVEGLLRSGASILERGARASERRLLRLAEDVVRVERVPAEPRPPGANGGRARYSFADLVIREPAALALGLHARSALGAPDRTASRTLLDRFDALDAGSSDVLLIACDRRQWDGLRLDRRAADGEPAALSRLCATLLPATSALSEEWGETSVRLGGRGWVSRVAVTPMVFGAQRVVGAVWPTRRGDAVAVAPLQLDAFAG